MCVILFIHYNEVFVRIWCFFFQAEDGIRDLVRSRGLGDVYKRQDADNYGNLEVDSLSCEIPDGFVEDDNDCDDTNPLIYPGADEILNGIDDNCDQLIDEGLEINNVLASLIKIYPNPANDILNLEYSGAEVIFFEIINAVGEKVLTGEINNPHFVIDISKLAGGVYFFRVRNDGLGFEIEFVKE